MLAERNREDKAHRVESERQKVGRSALTFLADEMDGTAGLR